MNIRDYIFIKKAKSSNKIKILEVLGFESDITLFQSPEIIKNFDKEILNFVQVCPKEMLDKLKHPITTKSTIKKVS